MVNLGMAVRHNLSAKRSLNDAVLGHGDVRIGVAHAYQSFCAVLVANLLDNHLATNYVRLGSRKTHFVWTS